MDVMFTGLELLRLLAVIFVVAIVLSLIFSAYCISYLRTRNSYIPGYQAPGFKSTFLFHFIFFFGVPAGLIIFIWLAPA